MSSEYQSRFVAGAGLDGGLGVLAVPGLTFGYAAAEFDPKRPFKSVILRSEDKELEGFKRRIAVTSGRELRRNFSAVGWAIRRHADYVSRFSFTSKIGDEEIGKSYESILTPEQAETLNRQVEETVWEWSRPGNFEVTGRFSLNQFMRLVETARIVDGDIGIVKLADGRVQAVEGDRIRDDSFAALSDYENGVKTDRTGRPLAYKIFKRSRVSGELFEFERIIPAEHMILHGYFDRFDQVRGISPLLSSARSFTDLYENFDYALFKSKVSQMMAYKFTVNEAETVGELTNEQQKEKAANDTAYRKARLGDSTFVELGPGEDMELVAANTPTSEFQAYSRFMIQVALKGLDIPYTMFDETVGKFYGNESAVLQYIDSTKAKREDNEHLLNRLTRWRLTWAVATGRLKLPEGMTADDIYFTWTPNGLPWWNNEQQTKGLFSSIVYGFMSPTEACALQGKDFKEVARQRKKDFDFLESLGLPVPSLNTPQLGGEFQDSTKTKDSTPEKEEEDDNEKQE
jgi:capsid protein